MILLSGLCTQAQIVPYVNSVQRQVLRDLKDLKVGAYTRLSEDSILQSYSKAASRCDSVVFGLKKVNGDLRGQVSLLYVSQSEDRQEIKIVTKELKKARRQLVPWKIGFFGASGYGLVKTIQSLVK